MRKPFGKTSAIFFLSPLGLQRHVTMLNSQHGNNQWLSFSSITLVYAVSNRFTDHFAGYLRKEKKEKEIEKKEKEGISQHHHPLDSNIINLNKRFPFQCEIVQFFLRATRAISSDVKPEFTTFLCWFHQYICFKLKFCSQKLKLRDHSL